MNGLDVFCSKYSFSILKIINIYLYEPKIFRENSSDPIKYFKLENRIYQIRSC